MAKLPVDKHGRPVPWFVAWIDGKPDFRVIGPGKVADAINFERCWLCGQHRGRYSTFVIGPMCAVNRISAEPPSHGDCAVYAAQACPFLTTPNMRRRDSGKPEGTSEPAGTMIRRNPGVTLLWTTRDFKIVGADDGYGKPTSGPLFQLGDPTSVGWFAEGRTANRDEVLASIESGLPLLRESAENESDAAVAELERRTDIAMQSIPGDRP
jgi:hypothetical protein